MHRHAKTMIFQQILRFLQKRYGPTDQRTDGPTDQRTDIPSYRDAIAASKNNSYCSVCREIFSLLCPSRSCRSTARLFLLCPCDWDIPFFLSLPPLLPPLLGFPHRSTPPHFCCAPLPRRSTPPLCLKQKKSSKSVHYLRNNSVLK